MNQITKNQKSIITKKTLPKISCDQFITLHTTEGFTFTGDGEPLFYIYDNDGTIRMADDNRDDIIVGMFKTKKIDLHYASENDLSLFELLDSDPDTLEYIDLLNEGGDSFSKNLINTLSSRFNWLIDQEINIDSILILDKLAIDPKYRGTGMGLFVLNALINRFRLGTGLVVMQPYPLQYIDYKNRFDYGCKITDLEEKWSKASKASNDLEIDTKKLIKYYEKLGFVVLPGTKLMVRPPYLMG